MKYFIMPVLVVLTMTGCEPIQSQSPYGIDQCARHEFFNSVCLLFHKGHKWLVMITYGMKLYLRVILPHGGQHIARKSLSNPNVWGNNPCKLHESVVKYNLFQQRCFK